MQVRPKHHFIKSPVIILFFSFYASAYTTYVIKPSLDVVSSSYGSGGANYYFIVRICEFLQGRGNHA